MKRERVAEIRRWAVAAVLLLAVCFDNGLAAGQDINDRLLAEARFGNLDQIKALLAAGADVNASDNKGVTVLMAAARKGNVEVVKFLLAKNANINAKTKVGGTVLMFAATGGNLEVTKLLLDKGIDVNAKITSGETALFYAASEGNLEMVRLLLEKGADVNAKTASGITVLTAASRTGNMELVKLLLDKSTANGREKSAPEITYLQITPPPTYQKVTQRWLVDKFRKEFRGAVGDNEGIPSKETFFQLFLKSYTESLFVVAFGVVLPHGDLDLMYKSRVEGFQKQLESGRVLKTSNGVTRVTVDGVSGVLVDRETPRETRVLIYTFLSPFNPDELIVVLISAKSEEFKKSEREIAEMINGLRFSKRLLKNEESGG